MIRWLRDFATDGGIGQLRTVLQSHVQIHGLAQRCKDVSRDVDQLRATQLKLLETLPAETVVDTRTHGDKLQVAEKELRALVDLYQDAANRLDNLRFTVTLDDVAVPLGDVLLEEIVFRVCEWPEWDSLWQQARDGYITEPTMETDHVFRDDDDTDNGPTTFPTRSEDFYESFTRTVEELSEFTRKLINDGVNEWLNRLRDRTVSARSLLATALERKTLSAEIKSLRLGDRATGMVQVLRAAVDPPRLKKLVFPPRRRHIGD